jgi:hypothetical protein
MYHIKNIKELSTLILSAKATGDTIVVAEENMGRREETPGVRRISLSSLNKLEMIGEDLVLVTGSVTTDKLLTFLNERGLSPIIIPTTQSFSVTGSLVTNVRGWNLGGDYWGLCKVGNYRRQLWISEMGEWGLG